MKKITLMCAALATAMAASAQWNTDKYPVQFGDAGDFNNPKVALTQDGKMFVSWRTSAISGNALCYSYPHLQLIDKDGKLLFGKNGLAISDHKSPSWNSDYSLVATSDGCAVVSNADSRTEESEDLEYYNAFVPVWYKIDQQQNYVWGLDGLALTDRTNNAFTDTYVVGDDVWIQDHAMTYGEVNYFNRVTPDGTIALPESQKIFGQIAPSIGTDFININSGEDGPVAKRYTRDGKEVWTEPVTFASNNFGGHDFHPYKIGSDGKGGVYVVWVRNVGDFGHTICAQHITADGDTEFGLDAMDVVADENLDIDYPSMAVDKKNNTALVAFARHTGGDTYGYYVQKFNSQGDRLFGDEGKQVDFKSGDTAGFAFNNRGTLSVGDGEWLICYTNVEAWETETMYVARLDKDGNVVWKQQIGDTGVFNDISFVKGDGCSYIIYMDKGKDENDYSYNMLKGVRIFDDGTFVQDNTTALPYSIDFTTSGKPADWAYLDMSTPKSDYGHWAYGNTGVKINKKMKYIDCVFTGINFDDTAWDDYYISPEFKLDANKAYKVKSQTMRDGQSYDLTLEYGTSLTDAATFTKFADCTMQKNDNYDENKFDEATLKVEESGVYRLAFHVTSTAKSPTDNVFLFNISIEEDGTDGIENVGDELSAVASATIRSIDGKLVKTIKGDKFNSASLAPGMYIITVKDAQGRTKSMKITK